jgi:hypothetical protein
MHLGYGITSSRSKQNTADSHRIEQSDSIAELDLSSLLPDIAHTCNIYSTFGNLDISSNNKDPVFKDLDSKGGDKEKVVE